MVITDWQISDLLDRLEPVLALGPSVAVQHRHPSAADRLFFEEGRALASRCARFGNPLFVNGRLDMALLLDAHLHLPARGMAIGDVRPHLPTPKWVSIAVHDLEEATASRGADLALISPVYRPGSKSTADRPPLGPEGFERLAKLVGCGAFALGGISPSNAHQIVGAAGFAVISSVLKAKDPREAAVSLLRVPTAAPR